MEYSSTRKARLPGIAFADFGDDSDEDYSTESGRVDVNAEEASPSKYDGSQRSLNNENIINGSSYKSSSLTALTNKKPKTPILSPTTRQLNTTLIQTAEQIVEDTRHNMTAAILDHVEDTMGGVVESVLGSAKKLRGSFGGLLFLGSNGDDVGGKDDELEAKESAALKRRQLALDDDAVESHAYASLSHSVQEMDSVNNPHHQDVATEQHLDTASIVHNELPPISSSDYNESYKDGEEDDDGSFYVGCPLDGFQSSHSIHDSDISETDDEAEEGEEEVWGCENSSVNEGEKTVERNEDESVEEEGDGSIGGVKYDANNSDDDSNSNNASTFDPDLTMPLPDDIQAEVDSMHASSPLPVVQFKLENREENVYQQLEIGAEVVVDGVVGLNGGEREDDEEEDDNDTVASGDTVVKDGGATIANDVEHSTEVNEMADVNDDDNDKSHQYLYPTAPLASFDHLPSPFAPHGIHHHGGQYRHSRPTGYYDYCDTVSPAEFANTEALVESPERKVNHGANVITATEKNADFIPSSLKNYLNEEEDKLSSLISSIEGLMVTPKRTRTANNDIMTGDDDDDINHFVDMSGLTPLRRQLQLTASKGPEIVLEEVEGQMLDLEEEDTFPLQKLEVDAMVEEVMNAASHELEEESGAEVVHDHLPQSPLDTRDESIEEKGARFSPAASLQENGYVGVEESGFESGDEELKVDLEESSQSFIKSPLLTTPTEAAESPSMSAESVDRKEPWLEVGARSIVDANHGREEEEETLVEESMHEDSTETAPSPTTNQLQLATVCEPWQSVQESSPLPTPELDEHLHQSTSPVNIPPSYSSSVLSPAIKDHPHHQPTTSPVNDSPQSDKSEDDTDDVAASLKQYFTNAESIWQNELASPILHSSKKQTDNDQLGSVSNVCEDYVKPPHEVAEPELTEELQQSIQQDRVESFEANHSPLDAIDVNRSVSSGQLLLSTNHSICSPTQELNLDSLRGAFQKAESQLESAASSIALDEGLECDEEADANSGDGLQPYHDNHDAINETANETFDTAKFSLGDIANTVDDFFDADDEAAETKEACDAPREVELDESCVDVPANDDGEGGEPSKKTGVELAQKLGVAETLAEEVDLPSVKSNEEVEDVVASATNNIGTDTMKDIGESNVDVIVRLGAYLNRMAPDVNVAPEKLDDEKNTFSVKGDEDHLEEVAPIEMSTESTSEDLAATVDTEQAGKVLDMLTDEMNSPAVEPMEAESVELDQSGYGNVSLPPAPDESTSKSNEDLNESMFMPNISMEVTASLSPVLKDVLPVATEQDLTPMMSEDYQDSEDEDEDFFPNRDLTVHTKKPAVKVASMDERTIKSSTPVLKEGVKPQSGLVAASSSTSSKQKPSTRICASLIGSSAKSSGRPSLKSNRQSLPSAATSRVLREKKSMGSSLTSSSSPRTRLSVAGAGIPRYMSATQDSSSKTLRDSPFSRSAMPSSTVLSANRKPKTSSATFASRNRLASTASSAPSANSNRKIASPPSNMKPARKRNKAEAGDRLVVAPVNEGADNSMMDVSTLTAATQNNEVVESELAAPPKPLVTVDRNTKPPSRSCREDSISRVPSLRLGEIVRPTSGYQSKSLPPKTSSTKQTERAIAGKENSGRDAVKASSSLATSSIRRSLVSITKSHTSRLEQLSKPRARSVARSPRSDLPPPSQRKVSSGSERLSQLAKPRARSVARLSNVSSPNVNVKKMIKPKSSKPPSFLSRQPKRYGNM